MLKLHLLFTLPASVLGTPSSWVKQQFHWVESPEGVVQKLGGLQSYCRLGHVIKKSATRGAGWSVWSKSLGFDSLDNFLLTLFLYFL